LIELIEYAEILAGILFLAVVAVLCVKYAIIPLIAAIKYAALPQKEKDKLFVRHFLNETIKQHKKNPDVIKMHLQRKRFSGEPLSDVDAALQELDIRILSGGSSVTTPPASPASRPAIDGQRED
jgi:hypothetical protein